MRAVSRYAAVLLPALLLLVRAPAVAQQTYIGSFDVYGGFAYFESPKVNLAERGFQFQTGYRVRTWLTFGFDYGIATGHTDLTPNVLTSALQTQLGTQFAGLVAAGVIPPNYALVVPIDSTTQNFAAGPQFSYHGFKAVTLFIRPSIGAVHEVATAHATDPIVASVIAQLAPGGQKTDWTGFYGVGGGVDVNVTDHFAIRLQADFVHDHLFSDVLQSRNTIRFGVGPAWQFGGNKVK